MPALRGTAPDQKGIRGPSEGRREVAGRLDAGEEGEGAVVELHDDALEGLHGRLDLEQAEHDGLIRPEQLARGDAERAAQ